MDTSISSIPLDPAVLRARGRTWRPALRPYRGIRRAGRRRPLYEPPAPPGSSGPPDAPSRPADAERETLTALMTYWPKLLEMAAAHGIADGDAPDVAEFVVLRALRAFRGEDVPRKAWLSWLETATRYVADAFRRSRSTRPLDVRDPAELHQVPDERGERDDDLEGLTLDDLRAATKPPYWRVFRAYAVEGIGVKDIAAAEQIPEATVYNRLRLARRDLRAWIERHRARRVHAETSAAVRASKRRAKR